VPDRQLDIPGYPVCGPEAALHALAVYARARFREDT
jgi:hypothetical protein